MAGSKKNKKSGAKKTADQPAPAVEPAAAVEQAQEQAQEQSLHEHAAVPVDPPVEYQTFPLTVLLPRNQGQLQFLVHPHVTISEIRQLIFDSPEAKFYTCFYLTFSGKRLTEVTELGDIPELSTDSALQMMEDVYTDREVRVHITRCREILTNFQSPIPTFGVDPSPTFLSTIKVGEPLDSKTHAFSDYDFDHPADKSSLSDFVPVTWSTEGELCLKQLTISAWNPPPFYRKTAGDLMYLTAVTLDDQALHITASSSGFFVSSSTDDTFDPKPHPTRSARAHTLPGCLSKASPSFETTFAKVFQDATARHPFEYIISNSGVYPWAVRTRKHRADAGRALDAYVNAADAMESFGARDWNEELQTARELPKDSPQERVLRDQAIFKLHSEFVDASIRGAMAIVDRSVMSLNPNEVDQAQMFLHNNIFFSYDHRENFEHIGGPAAAHVAVSKDVDGVRALSNIDLDGVYTLGTTVIDWRGYRIVAQTIVPGILKVQKEKESSIKYGSIDGRNHVVADSEFHEAAAQIAEALHLDEHQIVGSEGSHQLYTSIDTKGVLGTDGRKYFLDLYRITPLDTIFLQETAEESDMPKYPHGIPLLRTELIEHFYSRKVEEFLIQNQEKLAKAKDGEIDPESLKFSLKFNVDALTQSVEGDGAVASSEQEEVVREASRFLNGIALPNLVIQLVNYSLNIPIDGEGLTRFFHRRGVNMRYLGKIAKLFDDLKESPVAYLKDLCIQEMIARAAKHILRKLLRDTPAFLVAECVAHFFNCLLSSSDAVLTANLDTFHQNVLDESTTLPFSDLTPSKLWGLVTEEVACRFRFALPSDFKIAKPTPLVRSLCLKVGIQIEARGYDWTSRHGIFTAADIISLYPVVKHAEPKTNFGDDAVDSGINSLDSNPKLGTELLNEALSIYEQVYGPIHPDTQRLYGRLAMLQLQAQETEAALSLQRKAVICTERIYGVDDPETAQQYMHLGYFEFLNGNTNLALTYMRHAVKYWELLSLSHASAETPTADDHIGAMLAKLEDWELSFKFYERCTEKNEALLTKDHPATIQSYQALTQSALKIGDFRKALNIQRSVYNYCKAKLGDDHERTKEIADILKSLTERAVLEARSKLEHAAAPVKTGGETVVPAQPSQPSETGASGAKKSGKKGKSAGK
ncbi:clustered mitochondria-domain-containing protein [Polychytrium aggregatum]|uniref:clustered mitochondria-domain-containing protein n=1 Tax=Polychytrium aggregatum TaxID=110093 RepID=UPI0022FEE656|nr:clustered mitochondria-domain-containing protein [Polychytrium aggregatum]KAI9209914.1 clustered mitochondria-domain-containing protein [Polychytrium aggregatum]